MVPCLYGVHKKCTMLYFDWSQVTAKWNNIKEPYIRKTCAVKPRHILSITTVREKRGTAVPNHYIKSSDTFFQLTKTPFDFVAMDKQSGPYYIFQCRV